MHRSQNGHAGAPQPAQRGGKTTSRARDNTGRRYGRGATDRAGWTAPWGEARAVGRLERQGRSISIARSAPRAVIASRAWLFAAG